MTTRRSFAAEAVQTLEADAPVRARAVQEAP
jgi:hypothetical protein